MQQSIRPFVIVGILFHWYLPLYVNLSCQWKDLYLLCCGNAPFCLSPKCWPSSSLSVSVFVLAHVGTDLPRLGGRPGLVVMGSNPGAVYWMHIFHIDLL